MRGESQRSGSMTNVATREHIESARQMRKMLSKLSKARDLIQLGAYQSGHDPELDQAIQLHPQLTALLQQDMHECAPLAQSRAQLARARHVEAGGRVSHGLPATAPRAA